MESTEEEGGGEGEGGGGGGGGGEGGGRVKAQSLILLTAENIEMKIVGREVGPILSWLSRLPVPASLNQSNGINSINFLGISWKLSEAAMKMSPASLSIVSRPPYLLNASVFVVVTIPIISSSHFPSGGGEMEGWSGGGGGGGERKARHMANVWFPYSEFNGGS